jgi:hypothetical protein
MSLSFLASDGRCPQTIQRREGGSVTKVVAISGADQNGTLTRKTNHFEARLFFLRQWKVYVSAQVLAQNKHSREAKGVREK